MSSRVVIVARDLIALQEDFSQDRALRNDRPFINTTYVKMDSSLRSEWRAVKSNNVATNYTYSSLILSSNTSRERSKNLWKKKDWI